MVKCKYWDSGFCYHLGIKNDLACIGFKKCSDYEPKEKTTKCYTMKECFDECGDNDVPYIEGGFNSASLETKKELFDGNDISLYPTVSLKQAFSDKWQIKRAEPMPYDVDDWLDYIVKLEQSTQTYKEIIQRYDGEKPQVRIDYILKRTAKDSFKEGENSGKINEWLRPEQVELREAASGARYAGFDRLDKALKNLKPPQ